MAEMTPSFPGVEMDRIKVVVRYLDGKVVKGFSYNFSPTRDHFRLFPADGSSPRGVVVLMKNVKAVFTVRDFQGNPDYNERKEYMTGEKPQGRKVEVTFHDGEVLVGSTHGYDGNRQCFCLFPADPGSNNIRVFVVLAAVKKVRRIDLGSTLPPMGVHMRAQA